MWEKVRRIWKTRKLRNSILFVLGMLVAFRLVAHIPIPGVDVAALRNFLAGNQIFGLLNMFSGGTIENFSIAMLGVGPYITSSIIFQLLAMVVPSLEEMQKEGESGQRKINMYTRITTVPLAILQAFSLIQLLRQSGSGIVPDLSVFHFVAITLIVTAGTLFLMWIGELITDQNIGNGVSIIIFAGIVSGLPKVIQNALINYNPADLYTYLVFIFIAIITVIGVVIISEGQRNIPVSYARQSRGGYGGAQSKLPLRVNTAGVIPIIFAVSVMLVPATIGQFFVYKQGVVAEVAKTVVALFQNQLFYGIVYFLMVFAFTYFYTAVIFHPQKIAENLQRQGGFIPGIRPGKQTEEYVGKTMTRLVFIGALFLALIAVLPLIFQAFTHTQSLALGGTSLLIVVSVAIDMAKQIEAQLTMYEYDRV